MASNYVDNKKLFQVLVEYKNQCAASPDNPPPIPEYVGECLLMIATRLSSKQNFASYTFRDEMIADAIENCILYMHNFDPAKSQNPFAYFTQVTHYAFIRRIEREKKYVYTKYKYALHRAQQKDDHVQAEGESHQMKDASWTSYENIHEFIRGYEEKLVKSKTPRVEEEEASPDIITFDILEDNDELDVEAAVDGQLEPLYPTEADEDDE